MCRTSNVLNMGYGAIIKPVQMSRKKNESSLRELEYLSVGASDRINKGTWPF